VVPADFDITSILSPASKTNLSSEWSNLFSSQIDQSLINAPTRTTNAPLSSLPQSSNPFDFNRLLANLSTRTGSPPLVNAYPQLTKNKPLRVDSRVVFYNDKEPISAMPSRSKSFFA
jgi:hypothetical protein